MPNCFQLYRKGQSEPAILQQVDTEIANHIGVPVDTKYWCYDWFHVIGFLIACKPNCDLGSETLRKEVCDWYDYSSHGDLADSWRDKMLNILAFLEEHYTSNNFVTIGKR